MELFFETIGFVRSKCIIRVHYFVFSSLWNPWPNFEFNWHNTSRLKERRLDDLNKW